MVGDGCAEPPNPSICSDCRRSPEAIVTFSDKRMRRHKAIGLVVDGLGIARSQRNPSDGLPTDLPVVGLFRGTLSSPFRKNILIFRIPKSTL